VGELGNLLNLGAQSADVNIHGSEVYIRLAFPDTLEIYLQIAERKHGLRWKRRLRTAQHRFDAGSEFTGTEGL
jgi:hypothetical protein